MPDREERSAETDCLTRGIQEIGAAIESEARPVFDQDFDPRGAREYMADPELNAGHRPEIA